MFHSGPHPLEQPGPFQKSHPPIVSVVHTGLVASNCTVMVLSIPENTLGASNATIRGVVGPGSTSATTVLASFRVVVPPETERLPRRVASIVVPSAIGVKGPLPVDVNW